MRPILKRSSASSSPSYTPTPPHHPSHPSSPSNAHPHSSSHSSSHPHPHHAVHFPPQPSLTRTFSAHSSSIYDRTPIAVTPNSCALPERGCPGRTYTLDESTSGGNGGSGGGVTRARRGHPNNGRDLHPRALAMGFHHNPHTEKQNINITTNDTASPTRSGFPALPALIPDLSSASESDESDGFVSPPQYQYQDQDAAYYTSGSVVYRRVSPGVGGEQYPPPLSFLPHPPSPPSHSHGRPHARPLDDNDGQVQIQRRRRDRRRSRSRSRSRSRDRVRTIATIQDRDEEDEYYEYDPLPLPVSSPSPYSSHSPSPSPYPYSSPTTSPSIPKPLRKPSNRKSALCRTLPSLDIIMDDPVDGGCLGGF